MPPPVSMRAQTLNTYWELRGLSLNGKAIDFISILVAAGYDVSNSTAVSTYRDRLNRIDVGLLCYNKCTVDELRKFAKDRGLQKRPEKLERRKLTASLMRADRKLTFSRFMDLPPELRNNITELYLAEFSTLTTPAQPPLTLVSKGIRKDTLSLFYACCSFRVELRTTSVTAKGRLVFPNDSSAFFKSIKKSDNMAHLTDLTIDLMHMKTRTSIGVVRVLKEADEEYKITWTSHASYFIWALTPVLDAKFAKEEKRISGKKLELADIWALRLELENAWKDVEIE